MLVDTLVGIQGQNWRHPGIKLLLKDVFFKKEAIFNPFQKEVLNDCMEKVLKYETSSKTEMKKLETRDNNIQQNPLNSLNEVKDTRTWTLSINGLDKWGLRQMGL